MTTKTIDRLIFIDSIILVTAVCLLISEIGTMLTTIKYQAPERIEVTAVVTAYTSSEDETDEDPWTTASGSKAGPGVIACPAKWPFGTIVEIEGQKYTCEDRMNRRYRDQERYDIWMPSKDEAWEWGKRDLIIQIHR